MTARGIEIGTAGEHIVCAELLLAGHRATLAGAGMPYDVVADIGGVLVRVAVKSCLTPKERPGREGSKRRYSFHLRRAQLRWNMTRTRPGYDANDADIFALVGLDVRKVAFRSVIGAPAFMWLDADTEQVVGKYRHPRGVGGFLDFTLEKAMASL